ncbi:hypothetical protein [Halarcobacter bivalviorum]|uniref:hypothetical protein n=1 Tax=Halarcobacter bivalviorum TaxID=663364 RepID=UPI00100A84C6|nr:hypothetical protein [Halarcobacter bivalviorum]RXK03579.1 hypothetical protein CRU97_12120 [Halarcobacter bivalviorum]
MTYYLDTNCVRQIKKVKSLNKHYFFTSALSIFEIISGINSQKEYEKRKNILYSINKSDLTILWELPRKVLIKSFNLPFNDTDSEATKIMMHKIIDSDSYQDALKISFNLGGEDYILKTFIEHDQDINDVIQKNINNNIQKVNKKERKEFRNNKIQPHTLEIYKELHIRKFLMTHLETNDVNNIDYIKSLDHYYEHNTLDNCFTLTLLLSHYSLLEGRTAGSNDGLDYQHLTYTSNIDFFVSDDKFYTRIPDEISEHLDFKFINFSTFKSKILKN